MRIKFLFFAMLLALWINPILGQTENWKSIEKANYKVSYPENWYLNESGQMGTTFYLSSPREDSSDFFQENVNLIIQNLTGMGYDLDTFTKLSEGQVKSMISESKIIESTRVNSRKTPYHKVIFTGMNGRFKLKFQQYYFVINEKAYILTFTSEEDEYDNYINTGQQILDSFSIN